MTERELVMLRDVYRLLCDGHTKVRRIQQMVAGRTLPFPSSTPWADLSPEFQEVRRLEETEKWLDAIINEIEVLGDGQLKGFV